MLGPKAPSTRWLAFLKDEVPEDDEPAPLPLSRPEIARMDEVDTWFEMLRAESPRICEILMKWGAVEEGERRGGIGRLARELGMKKATFYSDLDRAAAWVAWMVERRGKVIQPAE